MLDAFDNLTLNDLRALAASLRTGAPAGGMTDMTVQTILGYPAGLVANALRQLQQEIGSSSSTATVLEALHRGRTTRGNSSDLYDLVLSGPDVPGIPTADTAAVFRSLIEQAKSRVVIVGYAFYGGKQLFARLAEKMQEDSNLEVLICLDITRSPRDTSTDGDVVRRFAVNFREKNWPWKATPRVYYDRRGLDPSRTAPSCLHAKCVIVDRAIALVSSANFTASAQTRNIEAGVLIRDSPVVERLDAYFTGLMRDGGGLTVCQLP